MIDGERGVSMMARGATEDSATGIRGVESITGVPKVFGLGLSFKGLSNNPIKSSLKKKSNTELDHTQRKL